MRKAILLLSLILTACGGSVYTATGRWQGSATDQSAPYGSVLVRFDLEDQNGLLSGSHYAYLDGVWTYLGPVSGKRSGNNASFRVDAPGGYVQVNGRFDGDRFTGTYFIVAYNAGSVTADLSLNRIASQTQESALRIESQNPDPLSQALSKLR